MASGPSGTLTFLFTDVEGSTKWWALDATAMSASLKLHDEIVRSAIEDHDGYVFTTAGDAFCAAFARASQAVSAATEAQRRLASASWPGPTLRVRMGLHLGEAEERAGDYFGPVVNTAARVESAGHGGQVLITAPVRASADVPARSLGVHELRSVPEPLELWQVGEGDFPPLRAEAETTNLPCPPSPLIGRQEDVASVRRLLRAHRLVTLSATGGAGKTRLAIEVADKEIEHFPGGVWFVDLTSVTDDAQVAPAISRIVGFELPSTDGLAELAAYVARRDLLLVLDNCEHVIDACAEFAEATLATAGESRVLATSREWLDIDGEHTYPVPPLPSEGADDAAVRLFVERARQVSPGLELDTRTRADVVALCQRLDGVPLAIELAASRAVVFTVGELLAGLDDRFALLSRGRRRQRDRTLEATIDWSYELLDAVEQEVFVTLGVFADGFDLAAVASVCELSVVEAATVMETLVAKSMVQPATDGRFRLLESLKAYAEHRLVDAGRFDAVRDRHFEHYASVFGEADAVALTVLDMGRLRDFADAANGLAAAEWARSQQRWTDLARLLTGFEVVSTALGDPHGSFRRLQECASAVDDAHLRDRLLVASLGSLVLLADWPTAVATVEELKQSSDLFIAGTAHIYNALIFARTQPDHAVGLVERGAELRARADTTDHGLAEHGMRSVIHLQRGEVAEAAAAAQRVLDTTDQLGVASRVALDAVWTLIVCAWMLDDLVDLRRRVDIDMKARSFRTRDPLIVSGQALFTAVADLSDRAPAEGRDAVRQFALVAQTGRLAYEASDAMVLLALLALHEDDLDTGRNLVMSTGAPRTPHSGALAQETARRLGVGDELEAAARERHGDPQWLIEQPQRALEAELTRRSWMP